MKLHDYQEVARDHLRAHNGAALFLDMGLGKTATTLMALEDRHLPAIVCAPKRVAETVWKQEAALWRPDLTVARAIGDKNKRLEAIESGADIVVIGRDNLGDILGSCDKFNTLILDELSGFKTASTKRWKAAKAVAHNMEYVWGLTGTPAPNGLLDLWAQINLLDNGERLGKTFGRYRARFFSPGRSLPNGIIPDWHIVAGAEEKIQFKISDICLSMQAENFLKSMPSKTINHVTIPLPSSVKKTYRMMKEDLVSNVVGKDGVFISAVNAAVMSSKLSQISAGFLYEGDQLEEKNPVYKVIHTEKMSALREIVDGTGSPVLVFYRFKAEAEMIKAEFGDKVHTVDEKNIVERWNAGEIPILIAHPASAGHGLNLQKGPGHTAVWTTLPWSLEEWEQANARLARQGQKFPVMIHVLECEGTIDRAILARLENKTSVQDALMEHLEAKL